MKWRHGIRFCIRTPWAIGRPRPPPTSRPRPRSPRSRPDSPLGPGPRPVNLCPAMDRRRNHEPVTYAELRAILEPIFERHRETDEAFSLYKRMVPLGVAELLPEILADARVRKVLRGVAEGRWKGWQRWAA